MISGRFLTDLRSFKEAFFIFSTDPNFNIRDFFLLGPIPDKSSKIELIDFFLLCER